METGDTKQTKKNCQIEPLTSASFQSYGSGLMFMFRKRYLKKKKKTYDIDSIVDSEGLINQFFLPNSQTS